MATTQLTPKTDVKTYKFAAFIHQDMGEELGGLHTVFLTKGTAYKLIEALQKWVGEE